MTRILFSLAVLAVLTILVAGAFAQKNELGGTLGRTFISDQGVAGTAFPDSNIHFGHGLTFEANYGRHLLNTGVFRITLEVPAVFNPNEKLHFGGLNTPSSFASYFVTPSARVTLLPSGAVAPWISIGGGFGHFSLSSRLDSGQPNPQSGSTTGVFQLGLGLDVRIIHSLYLRGEVREFNSGEPQLNVNTGKSRFNNLFAGAGVAWHF